MTCCIREISLCIGQGNDKRFIFTAIDQDGVALDLDTLSEITFAVANRVNGTILLSKTLTGGGITKSAGGVFFLDVSDTESAALSPGRLYCEVRATSSAGDIQTIGAGPFVVQDTIIT